MRKDAERQLEKKIKTTKVRGLKSSGYSPHFNDFTPDDKVNSFAERRRRRKNSHRSKPVICNIFTPRKEGDTSLGEGSSGFNVDEFTPIECPKLAKRRRSRENIEQHLGTADRNKALFADITPQKEYEDNV